MSKNTPNEIKPRNINEMSQDQLWFYIRSIILQMKPFCLIDLYVYMEYKYNITNRNLLLAVLDEMMEEGLVQYGFIDGPKKDPNSSDWAFYIPA